MGIRNRVVKSAKPFRERLRLLLRHSGAGRRPEPGIQTLSKKGWIPGSPLRGAPE
jgi:hypothetical protein